MSNPTNGKDPGRVLTLIDNIDANLTTTEMQIASLEDTLKIFLKEDLSENAMANGVMMDSRNISPLLQKLDALFDRVEYINGKLAQLQSRIDV